MGFMDFRIVQERITGILGWEFGRVSQCFKTFQQVSKALGGFSGVKDKFLGVSWGFQREFKTFQGVS